METAVAENKLEKMTKEQLVRYASEKLGVKVDGSFSKARMIEAIEATEKAQQKAATEQTEAEAKKAATPDDPLVEVIFNNVEFPGADLGFTYEHHKYHLFHGKTCKLPVSVVEHLNSRIVPDNKYEHDPQTMEIIGVTKAVRNRFSCIPTELGKLVRAAINK